nr:chemosensory protein 9 [Conopomorpha sinensis]
MKAVCVVLFVLVAAAMASNKEERYNNLDIEELVSNKCVFKSYLDCFRDSDFCNAITETYRPDYLEAMLTACSGCNDKQKHVAHRFIDAALEQFPAESELLATMMDPTGILMPRITAAVKSY